MADKKIIDKKDVKENSPNDDEEILKNTHGTSADNITNNDEDQLKKKDDKAPASKTLYIP